MQRASTARRYNLSAHSSVQPLRVHFTNGRQEKIVGKIIGVRCRPNSEFGMPAMMRDCYVGRVHHYITIRVPWVNGIIPLIPWVAQ